ncbi:hypothetical protein THASP1DRAFT_17035 [Thamnocephalis sphaerospora]|uniref:RecF/RecN/SMC N-terminal domain-containing protein n=1 Tax=Thamnocephalis sphaerospora TaxID=78915 RepID=A0A4P9XND0_9FUNG|nr:hypothetical protein THASP1DRAFT_17035 [Thamnocephalis sphaerospora]|eukprot:RKP07454.1 hypothetical protein THASP1DRAFT_17035 [Thamnocephalis sphaerospora]
MAFSPRHHASQHAQPLEAEMGVIESVDMTDFMCHRRLTMRFGPHVNFVVGNNGSGKSAILTAIIICLGAKATFTQRASNLRSLIREGANTAEVIVRLRNCGEDAYHPELYGRTVHVERRIQRDGGSQYRLRNGETNAVVSSKREDLTAMCDHMGIQVDNPMNILSQDTAKAFLSSSKPEDKYEFFARGTQLTQLSEEYALIRESLENTERLLVPKRQALPDMKRALREAELRMRDMQQAQDLEHRLDGIKNEMAWAQVEEVEEHELYYDAPGVRNYVDQTTLLQRQHATLTEQINTLNDDIKRESEAMLPARQKIDRITAELRAKKARLAEFGDEERDMNSNIRRLRATVEEHQRRIEEETVKLHQDNRARHDEINAQIDDIRQQIAKQQEQAKMHGENEQNAIRRIKELEDALTAAKENTDQAERDGNRIDQLVRQLHEQQQDRLKAFGTMMPDVLRAIQREQGWDEQPIGPIGNYIKLRNPVWADTLESLIGKALSDFIVTNHADKARLIRILRQHRCMHPRVNVLRHDPTHDHSRGEPDQHFLTILRVLEIAHPMVTRQLVIHNRIEQIVLIEQREEAERQMANGYPRNVAGCYTARGFGIGTRSGGMATMALREYTGPPRLSVDVERKLREYKQQQQQYQVQHQRHQKECARLNAELQHCRDERQEEKVGTGAAQREINNGYNRIDQLKDMIQEDEPANLVALEEEKTRAQQEIEMIKQQFGQLAAEKQRVLGEDKELQTQLKEFQRGAAEIAERIDEIKGHATERLRCDSHIQHWTKKRNEELQRVTAVSDALDEQRRAAETAIQQAREYCPERVVVSKSATELDREIRQIQLRLQEAERSIGCTLDEVVGDVNTKRDAYARARRDIAKLTRAQQLLRNALSLRVKRLEAYKHMVAKRARHNFLWNLAQRGYTGKLDFDHKNRRLTPRVQTDEHVQDRTAEKDPRSLSGGEKSFSTICLLLALWESMGCPIRGLDEYDVFMDAVNRSISTRMIVDSARLAQRTQFILITPQSME